MTKISGSNKAVNEVQAWSNKLQCMKLTEPIIASERWPRMSRLQLLLFIIQLRTKISSWNLLLIKPKFQKNEEENARSYWNVFSVFFPCSTANALWGDCVFQLPSFFQKGNPQEIRMCVQRSERLLVGVRSENSDLVQKMQIWQVSGSWDENLFGW